MSEFNVIHKPLGSDFEFSKAEAYMYEGIKNELVLKSINEDVRMEVVFKIQTNDELLNKFYSSTNLEELIYNTCALRDFGFEELEKLLIKKTITNGKELSNHLLKYPQSEVVSFLRDQLHDIKDQIRDSKISGPTVNQKYADYYLSYFQDKLDWAKDSPEIFNTLKVKPVFKRFEDLFEDRFSSPHHIELFVKILREVEPKLIDDSNRWIKKTGGDNFNPTAGRVFYEAMVLHDVFKPGIKPATAGGIFSKYFIGFKSSGITNTQDISNTIKDLYINVDGPSNIPAAIARAKKKIEFENS